MMQDDQTTNSQPEFSPAEQPGATVQPDASVPPAISAPSAPISQPSLPPDPAPATPGYTAGADLPASNINDLLNDTPTPPEPVVTPSASISPAPSAQPPASKDGDLSDIKQKALSELSPLVDQLDQPPEEKFHTLMMLIQASDNKDLLEKAYQAAHSIPDEHARAQALFDIVNEINYFSSTPEGSAS